MYKWLAINWMMIPSLSMGNGWKSPFPSMKKTGWIWSSGHSTWFGEFSSVAGQPSIFWWRNPGTGGWYRASQHQPWAEKIGTRFRLFYPMSSQGLHLGSLCSLSNSRLLLEISWIRKQENMNSSTFVCRNTITGLFTSPPQEVVEEEVMRLMGRWGASLKSCLFALSFHVSQAVNLVTHAVSAKGWRAQNQNWYDSDRTWWGARCNPGWHKDEASSSDSAEWLGATLISSFFWFLFPPFMKKKDTKTSLFFRNPTGYWPEMTNTHWPKNAAVSILGGSTFTIEVVTEDGTVDSMARSSFTWRLARCQIGYNLGSLRTSYSQWVMNCRSFFGIS